MSVQRSSRSRLGRGSRCAGFSLLEAVTALVLVTITFMGIASGVIANSRAFDSTREEVLVSHALRKMAETIRGTAFNQIYTKYANFPFSVPENGIGATGIVSIFVDETANTAESNTLGLPRDLNGDGLANSVNVSANYNLLPIRLSLSWDGRDGTRTQELYFLLAEETN